MSSFNTHGTEDNNVEFSHLHQDANGKVSSCFESLPPPPDRDNDSDSNSGHHFARLHGGHLRRTVPSHKREIELNESDLSPTIVNDATEYSGAIMKRELATQKHVAFFNRTHEHDEAIMDKSSNGFHGYNNVMDRAQLHRTVVETNRGNKKLPSNLWVSDAITETAKTDDELLFSQPDRHRRLQPQRPQPITLPMTTNNEYLHRESVIAPRGAKAVPSNKASLEAPIPRGATGGRQMTTNVGETTGFGRDAPPNARIFSNTKNTDRGDGEGRTRSEFTVSNKSIGSKVTSIHNATMNNSSSMMNENSRIPRVAASTSKQTVIGGGVRPIVNMTGRNEASSVHAVLPCTHRRVSPNPVNAPQSDVLFEPNIAPGRKVVIGSRHVSKDADWRPPSMPSSTPVGYTQAPTVAPVFSKVAQRPINLGVRQSVSVDGGMESTGRRNNNETPTCHKTPLGDGSLRHAASAIVDVRSNASRPLSTIASNERRIVTHLPLATHTHVIPQTQNINYRNTNQHARKLPTSSVSTQIARPVTVNTLMAPQGDILAKSIKSRTQSKELQVHKINPTHTLINQSNVPSRGMQSRIQSKELQVHKVNPTHTPINQSNVPSRGMQSRIQSKELQVHKINPTHTPINQSNVSSRGMQSRIQSKELQVHKVNPTHTPISQSNVPSRGMQSRIQSKELRGTGVHSMRATNGIEMRETRSSLTTRVRDGSLKAPDNNRSTQDAVGALVHAQHHGSMKKNTNSANHTIRNSGGLEYNTSHKYEPEITQSISRRQELIDLDHRGGDMQTQENARLELSSHATPHRSELSTQTNIPNSNIENMNRPRDNESQTERQTAHCHSGVEIIDYMPTFGGDAGGIERVEFQTHRRGNEIHGHELRTYTNEASRPAPSPLANASSFQEASDYKNEDVNRKLNSLLLEQMSY